MEEHLQIKDPRISISPKIQGKSPSSLSVAQGEKEQKRHFSSWSQAHQPPEDTVTKARPQAALSLELLTQTRHFASTVWLENKGSKNTRSW